MQDKILFAAGLVALFIGLFIGVRTDNASKKMENELSEAKRLVVSLEQQVGTERTKSSSLDQQLQAAARKLTASENKLTTSTSWYDKLQDENSNLAKDIYHIRLSLEDVSADLQDGRQSEALDKTQELMKFLDEHHAVTKEETAAQGEKGTPGSGEPAVTAGKETAEGSPAPQKEEGATMNKQTETSVPAEQGQDESRTAADKTKQQPVETNDAGEQEKTPQGDDSKKETHPEKVQL